MGLTKSLGYKYLWVDSVCIIQDDKEDWDAIVDVMDAVYNLAALTICAAGGDSSFGTRGIVNNSRQFRQTLIRYNETVQLMVSHPAEHFIKHGVWDSRAWTFQEHLCSRRLLIFVHDRVFYNCRQSIMCEDIHMEKDSVAGGQQSWSLEMRDALGRLFSENPLRQYTKCVQLFTRRHMTKRSDKLPAFHAIATLLSTNLSSEFQVGLPTSYLNFALLWTPSASLRWIPDFPSWSWSGWDDAIQYSYPTLEGALVNIHDWLAARTWVEWYVVTPHSEPALAWSGEKTGLTGRWEGYAQPSVGLSFSTYGRTKQKVLGTLRTANGIWLGQVYGQGIIGILKLQCRLSFNSALILLSSG